MEITVSGYYILITKAVLLLLSILGLLISLVSWLLSTQKRSRWLYFLLAFWILGGIVDKLIDLKSFGEPFFFFKSSVLFAVEIFFFARMYMSWKGGKVARTNGTDGPGKRRILSPNVYYTLAILLICIAALVIDSEKMFSRGNGLNNASHTQINSTYKTPATSRALGVAGSQSRPQDITVILPGGVPLVFALIPHGNFQMGSSNSERSRYKDEGPVHLVNIKYNFYMGKYLLTQKQWLAVMKKWPVIAPDYPSGKSQIGDNYPAYDVSWNDCQNFVTALNKYIASTGQGPATFRLPSESEWEYACRGGTQTRFFFGDSLSVDDIGMDGPAGTLPGNRSDYTWWQFNCKGDANGTYGIKPVGMKLPNPFGLYDINGNINEWCQDCYQSSYVGAPTDGSAWIYPASIAKVSRGGSWYREASDCRSALRHYYSANHRASIGVRLVRAQ